MNLESNGLLVIRSISVATREVCGRGTVDYSQNIRTFEELYDDGYIKADTHGVTQSTLGGGIAWILLAPSGSDAVLVPRG